MKKYLSIALALAMTLSLAACSSSSESTTTTTTTTTTTAETTTEVEVAEDWVPEKEITIICPWSAGGAGDISSRMLQSILQDEFGVTAVVEVVEGGSSAVGLTQVMTTGGDGYTVGLASSTWLSLMALGNVPYTPDDCKVVSTLYDEAFFLLVPADSPYQTAEELMDAVAANPGTVTIGGSGSANVNQTYPVLLAQSVDSTFNYTSFDGGSRVLTEVLGGNSDCAILKPIECAQYIESGELIALGLFGSVRLDSYPDIATFPELGYDIYASGEIAMASYWLAPASADAEASAGVAALLQAAMATDTFQDYCLENAFSCDPMIGDDAEAYIGSVYDGINTLFNQLYT